MRSVRSDGLFGAHGSRVQLFTGPTERKEKSFTEGILGATFYFTHNSMDATVPMLSEL